MSQRSKDGGATFSCVNRIYDPISGMSLRDYFAAAALTLLGGRAWDHVGKDDDLIRTWAKSAYALADAMIAAREVDHA